MSDNQQIEWSDFEKTDMRIGTIVGIKAHTRARKPAYILSIDFGKDIGEKISSAQITDLYSEEELLNRQIIAVVNFPPRNIAGIMSEVLVLGAPDDNGAVILLSPTLPAPNGSRIF